MGIATEVAAVLLEISEKRAEKVQKRSIAGNPPVEPSCGPGEVDKVRTKEKNDNIRTIFTHHMLHGEDTVLVNQPVWQPRREAGAKHSRELS